MSAPPTTLRVKRKRLDQPPDALYIKHDVQSKRQATLASFYYRREIDDTKTPVKPQSTAEARGTVQSEPRPTTSPRRFTLAKPSTPLAGRKRALDIATFTEDRDEHTSPSHLAKSNQRSIDQSEPTAPPRPPPPQSEPQLVLAPTADPTSPSYFASPDPQRSRKADIRNCRPRPPPPRLQQPPRSSPDAKTKALLAQFADEAIPNPDVDTVMADVDGPDSEYIYETYKRYELPVAAAPSAAPASGDIGYLIISSNEDQELWESYADDLSDGEGDWDSEQDDENAENYYGADYPEDEVSDDDEYGVNEWKYRNKPADEEEFDLVDDVDSDEEGEAENEFEMVGMRGKLAVD